MGSVILVGAGPGDPGLLTQKGRQAIENAQVVVYDRLVSPAILSLIPKDAEKINVGKESSNHLVPQEEINRILLRKAQEDKRVVRLKGGDPFLFGRGGEELELLKANGVPFEVGARRYLRPVRTCLCGHSGDPSGVLLLGPHHHGPCQGGGGAQHRL